MLMIWEAYHFI